MPAQAASPRADLEQVGREAEFRVFSFSEFWGRDGEIPRESISVPTSRDRSASVRDRIGLGSISDGLFRWSRWVLKK
jgi:hypothetical protein